MASSRAAAMNTSTAVPRRSGAGRERLGWSGGLADTDTDNDDGDNIHNDDHGDSWRNGITKKRLGDAGPQNTPINSSYFLTTTRAPTYFLASLFSIEFSIARWTTRTDARHTMRVWDWGASDAPEAAHERCWDNKLCVSPRGAQSPSEKVCQRLAKPARGSEFRASLTATMVLTQTKQWCGTRPKETLGRTNARQITRTAACG